MTFTLPNLETLKVNTNNLDVRLTTLLGRYQVNATVESGAVKPSTLEVLIARINKLSEAPTDRKEQQAVFTTLVNDLRRFLLPDAEEQDRKLAPMILLGALLHRYFRLIKSYEDFDKRTKVPLFGFSLFSLSKVTSCRLFLEVREALQLPSDTTNFKENDLKLLDGVTIVTALERFQTYMLQDDKFKAYEHLRSTDEGVNFKLQLQEVITEHKVKAAPVLQLFHAVIFLQSLETKLQEEHKKVTEGLDAWFKLLKAEHKDFSRLPAAIIEDHLKVYVTDPLLQARFIKLLKTPHIEELLYDPVPLDDEAEAEPVATTPDKFLIEMKNCNSGLTSYAMVGGYSLILELTEQAINRLADKYKINRIDLSTNEVFALLDKHKMSEDDKYYFTAIGHLQYCIYQALDIESERDELTKKHKARGVQLLKEFLETKPELDMLYFESAPKLEREVALLKVKLSRPDLKPISGADSSGVKHAATESPKM
jgi:hypothetical protein